MSMDGELLEEIRRIASTLGSIEALLCGGNESERQMLSHLRRIMLSHPDVTVNAVFLSTVIRKMGSGSYADREVFHVAHVSLTVRGKETQVRAEGCTIFSMADQIMREVTKA